MTYNTIHTYRTEPPPTVTVRLAEAGDSASLARLAALDSAASLEGPTLVAEVDGELLAALPVHGGAPIADPFSHTTELVEMLRLRAGQLRGDRPAHGLRVLRPRRVAGLLRPQSPAA